MPPPLKSLTSSAQKKVLCSLVHCVQASWHMHPSKLVSHSLSPKRIDFLYKKKKRWKMLCDIFGRSQKDFTYSSIKILVQCYQVWRTSMEICGTIGKHVAKGFRPLTKSQVGILGLPFTCLYFSGQGVTDGRLWGGTLACPHCPSCLQELRGRTAKKCGQIIWESLFFILEYCSPNGQWILAEGPCQLLVEWACSQCRLEGSLHSGT